MSSVLRSECADVKTNLPRGIGPHLASDLARFAYPGAGIALISISAAKTLS